MDFFDFFGIYSDARTEQYMFANVEFEYNAGARNFGMRGFWDNDLGEPPYKLSHYEADTYLFKNTGSLPDNPDGTVTFTSGTYPYVSDVCIVTWYQNGWVVLSFNPGIEWGFVLTNNGKTFEMDGANGWYEDLSFINLPSNAKVYPALISSYHDAEDGKNYFFDLIGQPIFHSPDASQEDFRTGTPTTSSVKSVRSERPSWAKNLDFSKTRQIPVKNIKNLNR
jgi:hypothetical protein